MEVQSIKILSCPCLYWCGIDADTETEQHLTVSATGRVWFKRMINGENNTNVAKEKIQLSIGKEKARDILKAVEDYFNKFHIENFGLDAGVWFLIIQYTDGRNKKFAGSLFADNSDEINKLCKYIRKNIPINDLLLFDENEKEYFYR